MAAMVLIYNAGGVEVHDVKPMRHVITMLHRGVARVLEPAADESFGPYARPHSVELVRYVYARWRYERTAPATYSFKAVLRRDLFTCGYCGRSADTVDHVVPRCQAGTSTWTNSVAACRGCNETKGGRTPLEAGMRLLWEPTQPGVTAVRKRHAAA